MFSWVLYNLNQFNRHDIFLVVPFKLVQFKRIGSTLVFVMQPLKQSLKCLKSKSILYSLGNVLRDISFLVVQVIIRTKLILDIDI